MRSGQHSTSSAGSLRDSHPSFDCQGVEFHVFSWTQHSAAQRLSAGPGSETELENFMCIEDTHLVPFLPFPLCEYSSSVLTLLFPVR